MIFRQPDLDIGVGGDFWVVCTFLGWRELATYLHLGSVLLAAAR